MNLPSRLFKPWLSHQQDLLCLQIVSIDSFSLNSITPRKQLKQDFRSTVIMSFHSGWLPDIYDANDKPYRCQMEGPLEAKVDLSVKHPGWLDEVYDQRQIGSCTANATAAAFRFLAHKLEKSSTRLVIDPSRAWIYYYARVLPVLERDEVYPEVLGDTGSDTRNAMKAIKQFGVCPEKSWPYEEANIPLMPSVSAQKEAKPANVVEYCRLDPDHPDHIEKQMTLEEKKAVGVVTLSLLRQCLSEGYPVVFGYWYYWEFPPFNKEAETWVLPALPESQQHSPPPKRYNREKAAPETLGGHTVLAIGYDDSRKQVLCQNSWGTGLNADGKPDAGQSKDGRFWMDYSWITDWEASDDFWMIRETQRPDPAADVPAGVPASLLCAPEIEAELVAAERAFLTAKNNRERFAEYRFDYPVGSELEWSMERRFNDADDLVDKIGHGKWPTQIVAICGPRHPLNQLKGVRLCYGDTILSHGGVDEWESRTVAECNLAEGEKIIRVKIYKQLESAGGEVAALQIVTNKDKTWVWQDLVGPEESTSRDFTPPPGFTGLKGFYGHCTSDSENSKVQRLGLIWGR